MHDDDYLTALRMVANRTLRKLHDAVAQCCEGPHLVQQYRDGKPPHCTTCQRTPDGVRV